MRRAYRAVRGWTARLAGSALGATAARAVGLAPRTIWCLHRFTAAGDPWAGDRVDIVARHIEVLAGRGVRFVPLDDLLAGDDFGAPAVAVTIDDGYEDIASRAWPMFKALRCPITVYLTTAPVTDRQWFWGDFLEHCLDRIAQPFLDVEAVGLRVDLADPQRRGRTSRQLREALKLVPDEERRAVLMELAATARVEADEPPTAPFRALVPEQIRQLTMDGVNFGAHTVTHPILSRCSAPLARHEIEESVRIVQALSGRPVTSFAYPNGTPCDFGAREVDVLRAVGVPVAVTTSRGRVDDAGDRWRVPRLIFSADLYAMSRRVVGFPMSI